jgi:hypothetical protein
MPTYSLTITDRRLSADPAALIPHRTDILSAYAKIAEIEVKRDVWNYSMFVYKGIKPKPSFSKSERAWIGSGNGEDLTITLTNGATNKKGTVYVPCVHLAGRPRSDKLVRYVRAHLVESIAPRAIRPLVADMIKGAQAVQVREVKVS